MEVHIQDNIPGRNSALFGHSDGAVALAPYVGFRTWRRALDGGALDQLGVAPEVPKPPVELPVPAPPLTPPKVTRVTARSAAQAYACLVT